MFYYSIYLTNKYVTFTGIFFTDGYFWHVQRRFSFRYLRDYGFGRRDATLEAVISDEIKEMLDMRLNGPKYPVEMVINILYKSDLYTYLW